MTQCTPAAPAAPGDQTLTSRLRPPQSNGGLRSAQYETLLQKLARSDAAGACPLAVVGRPRLVEDDKGGIVGRDRLLQPRRAGLPLAQPLEGGPKAGLGHGPVERHPIASAFLER